MLISRIYKFLFILFFNVLYLLISIKLYSSTNISRNTNQELINKYFQEGINFYIARDFKSAAEMWKKVLDLEPTHQQAKIYFEKAYEKYQEMMMNYYKGIESYKKDKCNEAIDYFKKSLLINPRFEKCRDYLNLAYKCLKITLKIFDKPTKDGKEVGDIKITTDEGITLYAVGFDGKGKFIGPVEVNWESIGDIDPINITNEYASFINYIPSKFGTKGKIKIYFKDSEPDETGEITVLPGKLQYIKIASELKPDSEQIHSLKITTDQTLKLYSLGFDKNKNYIGQIPVEWQFSTLNSNFIIANDSSELKFSPNKTIEKAKIIAKSKLGITSEITDIQILPGKLKYVRIETKPNGEGEEVYSLNITADDVLKFYAVGYDSKDNLIGNINVDWQSEIPCENTEFNNVSQFIFSPTKAYTEGKIRVLSKSNLIGDETGIIKVSPGKVAKVSFFKDENFKLSKKVNIILFTPTKISASGFDQKDNFVKKLQGNWIINYENVSNLIVASNSEFVSLHFTNIINNASLILESPEIKDKLLFDVILPEIKFLKLVNLTNNQIISNIVLNYNDKISLIAFGLDDNNNLIKPVECLWKTTGNLESFLNKRLTSTNEYYAKKGNVKGEIILETENLGKIKVGEIEVLPPPLEKVEMKNIIIYIVYNGDNLTKILRKILYLPNKWSVVKKYVIAIATYNNLKNQDLIFPLQKILIPYFSVETSITKEELALKIFGDSKFKDKIVIYKKPISKELIEPDDKIILKDFNFLSTGKLDGTENKNLEEK